VRDAIKICTVPQTATRVWDQTAIKRITHKKITNTYPSNEENESCHHIDSGNSHDISEKQKESFASSLTERIPVDSYDNVSVLVNKANATFQTAQAALHATQRVQCNLVMRLLHLALEVGYHSTNRANNGNN
jgi:hypothetical protein